MTKEVRLSPSTTMPMMLILQQNTTFQFPPSDFEWSYGNTTRPAANAATGTFRSTGDSSGWVTPDAEAGGAGVGFVFNSDKPGSVVISPFVQHSWSYQVIAEGIAAWAKSKGGVEVIAWKGSSRVASRRAELFSAEVSWFGNVEESSDGYVWPPDIMLSFPIAASTWYAVYIGAWVETDQATGIGRAEGAGEVVGDVPWATVQRWTQ